MLFPAVCKLPRWWTILSRLPCFCQCKCLNRYMNVCMAYFTCLMYTYKISHNLLCPFLQLSSGNCCRGGRKRKTMKLSRDLSNLVVFTNSVASQECLNEGETLKLWHLHTHKQIGLLQYFLLRHLLMPNPCFLFRYSRRCFVIQRDQSPISGQSQSWTVPGVQPKAAVTDLSLSLSHWLVQFQPPVLLECGLSVG